MESFDVQFVAHYLVRTSSTTQSGKGCTYSEDVYTRQAWYEQTDEISVEPQNRPK